MSRALDLMTDACVGLAMTVKRMFGGHGFFAPNGGMFAGIVDNDEVILKLQLGPARDELIAIGGHPWVYPGRDKPMTMAEWIVVPEAFYDDQELLGQWAARALALAPAKKRPAPRAAKAAPRPPKKASTKAPKKKTPAPARKKNPKNRK